MNKVSVLVAPLIERTIPGKCFWPFMRIAARAPVDGYDLIGNDFAREDFARERVCNELLAKARNTHILMLDIDHNHPERVVKQLSWWAAEDPSRAIIGGLCFRRGPNYEPLAYIPNVGEGGYHFPFPSAHIGLKEVARVGAGAMLIAREVLEAMPDKGWFRYDYSGVAEGRWPTSDITFCDKARALGFKVFVDTNTISPHLIDGWVDEKTHAAYVETNEAARQQLEVVDDDRT